MTIGRPRPLPGYPTTLALYPISVRRVRVQGHRLPSDPTSRWAPLPSLAVPVITARGGLAPLTSTTCLAHKANGRRHTSPPARDRSVKVVVAEPEPYLISSFETVSPPARVISFMSTTLLIWFVMLRTLPSQSATFIWPGCLLPQ